MSQCSHCLVDKNICLNKFKKEGSPEYQYDYAKGDLIFDENEHLKGVYCIKSGVCKISKMNTNGKEQIIHFLKEGTLLGIRSLLNGETTNLKAEAITPVKVCFFEKNIFFETLNVNADFLNHLLIKFAEYLHTTDDRIVILGQKKVEEKLAHFLLKIYRDFGEDTEGNLALHLKRKDMANYIGVTMESTIRMLKSFEKKGLIVMDKKSLKIQDISGLQNISDGFNM